ncbi:dihydrofolate reductase [Haloarcula amylovorans]|uniref:dihydrofolate reductase n=1 Tax=Haloarcula amylovorans TaxID=2562280 RepID=UPI0010760EF0|nr:dihydrofolate reductase [Halomicroarcula amylolytica]
MRITLVAAVAANGVIGSDGDVPWYYPADLEHFKQTTIGHPVIMGRRTFEIVSRQLGSPLPERQNVVLTHHPASLPDDVVAVESTADAINAAEEDDISTAYVVGGGTIYEQFLPWADALVLTELDRAVNGDTTFPTVQWDKWSEIGRETYEAFDIVWYERQKESS